MWSLPLPPSGPFPLAGGRLGMGVERWCGGRERPMAASGRCVGACKASLCGQVRPPPRPSPCLGEGEMGCLRVAQTTRYHVHRIPPPRAQPRKKPDPTALTRGRMIRIEEPVDERRSASSAIRSEYSKLRSFPMPEESKPLRPLAMAEHQLLDQWAAQVLAGNPLPWPLGGKPHPGSRRLFQLQGIGPLCHFALQTAGAQVLVPPPVWDLLRQERQAAVVRDLMHGNQDALVIQWLANGLRPLVLKGAAYARALYPEAHLRPRCDTDLLFPDQESARRAWQRLEQDGYEPMPNVVEGRL